MSSNVRVIGWMALSLPALGAVIVLARHQHAVPVGSIGDIIVTVAVWTGTILPVLLLARARRHLAAWELWAQERRDMAGWTTTLIASVSCGLFAASTVRSDPLLAALYLTFAAAVALALGAQLIRIRRSRRGPV